MVESLLNGYSFGGMFPSDRLVEPQEPLLLLFHTMFHAFAALSERKAATEFEPACSIMDVVAWWFHGVTVSRNGLSA